MGPLSRALHHGVIIPHVMMRGRCSPGCVCVYSNALLLSSLSHSQFLVSPLSTLCWLHFSAVKPPNCRECRGINKSDPTSHNYTAVTIAYLCEAQLYFQVIREGGVTNLQTGTTNTFFLVMTSIFLNTPAASHKNLNKKVLLAPRLTFCFNLPN